MTTRTVAAAACVLCRTRGGFANAGRTHPTRTRGLCNRCKQHELRSGAYWGRSLSPRQGEPTTDTIPVGIVTPAMLGIMPGQPPVSPNLTPEVVWRVGNTNARRAIQWLTAHTGIEETQALARVVWTPALLDAEARKAA